MPSSVSQWTAGNSWTCMASIPEDSTGVFVLLRDEAEGNNETGSGRTHFFKETGKNNCECFKLWGKKLPKGVVKKQIPYLDRNSPHSTSLFSSLSFAFWISCMWSCRWLSWSFNILLYLIRLMFPSASRSFSSSRVLTSAGDIRVTLAEWLSSDLLQNSTGEKKDRKTARCSHFWIRTFWNFPLNQHWLLFLLSDYSHPWIRRQMLIAECMMHSRPKPTTATRKTRDKPTARHTQRTSCDDCVTCHLFTEAVLLP